MSSFHEKYSLPMILPLSNFMYNGLPFKSLGFNKSIYILVLSGLCILPVVLYISFPGGFTSIHTLRFTKSCLLFTCIYLGILTSMCFELEFFNKYLPLIPLFLLLFTIWFLINCIVIFTHSTYDLESQEKLLKEAKTDFENIVATYTQVTNQTQTQTQTQNSIDSLKNKLNELEKELNGVTTASPSVTQGIDSIISDLEKLKKNVLNILQEEIESYKTELEESNISEEQTSMIGTKIQTLENNIDKMNEIDFRNLKQYKNNNPWKGITKWTFYFFIVIVVFLFFCDFLNIFR